MIVYGIPNCNTVQKARTWLAAAGIAYTFHDFKKQGVPADKLQAWCDAFGWEKVLNKKGTTWKKLPAGEQEKVKDQAAAVELMAAHPSAIKRPVVEVADQPVLLGFEAPAYAALLKG